jgi:amino acid transporter
LDRSVDAGMRGQAQGLLGVVSGGVGPLLGAAVCGWMRAAVVGADGGGWPLFWGLLSAMSAACLVLFVVAFGRKSAA